MCVCAGACACVRVCVCVRVFVCMLRVCGCLCVCVCARARVYALRIVSMDKIMRFTNIIIIIIIIIFIAVAHYPPNVCRAKKLGFLSTSGFYWFVLFYVLVHAVHKQ